jgi:hypothetical protein
VPSTPLPVVPQLETTPWSSIASVCWEPTAKVATRLSALTGCAPSVLLKVPRPSWPRPLPPQASRVASARKATEWLMPPPTRTGAKPTLGATVRRALALVAAGFWVLWTMTR